MKKLMLLTVLLLTIIQNVNSQDSLQNYVEIAIQNNPGLNAKLKQFEASLQQISQSKALEDPRLTVSAFGQMVETRVGPQTARFSLSQMFPWFGTLKEKGNVAALLAEANFESYQDARAKLTFEVKKAYFPIYERKALSDVQKENLNLLQSLKSVALKNYENGKGTLVEVIRIETAIKEVKTNIAILEEKAAYLQSNFNIILNVEKSARISVPDTLETKKISYQNDSLNLHPKINEVNKQLKAMEARERLTVKQGYPNLGLGIDYIIVSEREDVAGQMNPPEDNGKDAIMPMVTVSLPIFRKKYKAAKKETQLMQEMYSYQRKETLNDLNTSFERLKFMLESEYLVKKLLSEQIADTDRALELSLTAYSNEGRQFEDLITIQKQLYSFKADLIKNITKIKTLEAEIDYILFSDQEAK